MRRKLDIASDFHGRESSPACVALLCAHLRSKQPATFIFNGDVVDFGMVSRFGPVGRLAPATILEEATETLTGVILPILEALGFRIVWHFELIDPTNPALKDLKHIVINRCENPRKVRVFWIEGNHESRLKRHLWLVGQAFDGLIDMSKTFCLNALGIDYVHSVGSSGNGILHLSPTLMVMHGDTTGVTQAKRQLDKVMGSVIIGHGHKQGLERKTSNVTGRDFICYASGCMSGAPGYNATPNYNRGFISGWYDDEPPYRFSVHHANIISEQSNLPDGADAYPKRVTEPDHNILVTPWAEFKATMGTKTHQWTVSQTWREGLPGRLERGAVRESTGALGKDKANPRPRKHNAR